MGGQGSGASVKGGALGEELEDVRFELVDAEEAERQAGVIRMHAERMEQKARTRRERAEARLILIERRLGVTHFRPDTVRVAEMTVAPIGDPAALARFAVDLHESTVEKVAEKKAAG